ncbi:MAG TPA: AMP-binding protein [Verrucomicrobiales bacterium]|nr:AMP-binding protein [Verrucomicrobiales bacterium]
MAPIYIHRFTLTPRSSPNARSAAFTRSGFLIRANDGFGCIQPWPELGDPTIDELLRFEEGTDHRLFKRAFECAIRDGKARREGRSLFSALTIPRSHATITGEADFPALAAAGFRTVKLKTRGTDRSIMDRVAAAAGAGLKIRIDCNGTGSEILPLLTPWKDAIEFIEDPEPYDAARWRELFSLTGFPLALDRLPPGVPDTGGYDVRVLKPALEICAPREGDVVFTSYMDHPLGQMFAAWEAARYPGAQREAGLLTHSLYEPDAFTEAIATDGPQLLPPSGTGLGFDSLLESLPWEVLRHSSTISVPSLTPWLSPDFWMDNAPLLLTNPRAPLSDPPHSLPGGCLLFATSGSTGAPALVCLTRRNLFASAEAVNNWLCATPDDIWLRTLPPFHVGGMSIHARAFLTKSRVVCDDEKWNPERFVSLITRERVTLTSLVPAQVHDLVSGRIASPPSLRAIIVGGGALAPPLLERARALGWPLLPSYGLTEASSQVATARPDDTSLPPRLELLPCWEARTDADGRLQLRGAPLCQGKLLRDPDGWTFHPALDAGGWFTTNDRAQVSGRVLTILGRCDRVIKVLGELVDLDAVESTLAAAGLPPGRGIVIALPDPRAGLRPWLVTDLSETEAAPILTAASAALPPFAAPAGTRHLPSLPRSSLGKILRAETEFLLGSQMH